MGDGGGGSLSSESGRRHAWNNRGVGSAHLQLFRPYAAEGDSPSAPPNSLTTTAGRLESGHLRHAWPQPLTSQALASAGPCTPAAAGSRDDVGRLSFMEGAAGLGPWLASSAADRRQSDVDVSLLSTGTTRYSATPTFSGAPAAMDDSAQLWEVHSAGSPLCDPQSQLARLRASSEALLSISPASTHRSQSPGSPFFGEGSQHSPLLSVRLVSPTAVAAPLADSAPCRARHRPPRPLLPAAALVGGDDHPVWHLNAKQTSRATASLDDAREAEEEEAKSAEAEDSRATYSSVDTGATARTPEANDRREDQRTLVVEQSSIAAVPARPGHTLRRAASATGKICPKSYLRAEYRARARLRDSRSCDILGFVVPPVLQDPGLVLLAHGNRAELLTPGEETQLRLEK